jgi:hypothetical protein
LKPPGFNPCAYEVKTRFQRLVSNGTCTAYTVSLPLPPGLRPGRFNAEVASVGLYKLNPVFTNSLKAPGFNNP